MRDEQNFKRFKTMRRLPNHVVIGSPVVIDGKHGVIVGCNESMNLDVIFDGDYRVSNCHPAWRTEYQTEPHNQ